MVIHYESLQGGAVDGTPLWGIFLASVQWPFRALASERIRILVFFRIFEVPTSTIVRILRASKGVPLTAPPFGAFFGFGSLAIQGPVA
jgi:hypothetical protein